MKLRRKLATVIRDRIEQRNVSVSSVAKLLPCTSAQLYDVVAGRVGHATLDRLIRYAAGLRVKVGLTIDGDKI